MKKIYYIVIILIATLAFNYNGYYKRNIEVNDDFLSTISETLIELENKRINNIPHTPDDDDDMHMILNIGHMAQNSRREMDISVNLLAMSTSLKNYTDAMDSKDIDEAELIMNKYKEYLSETEILLSTERKNSDSIELLWEKGIFE